MFVEINWVPIKETQLLRAKEHTLAVVKGRILLVLFGVFVHKVFDTEEKAKHYVEELLGVTYDRYDRKT